VVSTERYNMSTIVCVCECVWVFACNLLFIVCLTWLWTFV
jgi:hypothetical protein